MITDSFRGDIEFIFSKLKNKNHFAITRFGDGEMSIMENRKLNLLGKNEFNFQGQEYLRNQLIESFTLNLPNYFVGVSCPCCVGQVASDLMKKKSNLPDYKLTWANIFVNSNYSFFKQKIISTFSNYKTHLIAQGKTNDLKFNVDYFYPIGPDAWINNINVYDNLKNNIIENNIKNELFIFCAGPFANILISKLYREFPCNTYIDAGSVFNIELGIGANRGYLKGADTLNKVCTW